MEHVSVPMQLVVTEIAVLLRTIPVVTILVFPLVIPVAEATTVIREIHVVTEVAVLQDILYVEVALAMFHDLLIKSRESDMVDR